MRVVPNEKIRIHLPIHFKGESVSPGVKVQGGVVSHRISDVEVTCLPQDLPEFIELDLSQMNINETKFLSDLPLPNGVDDCGARLVATNPPVVSIHAPRAEEPEPTAEAAAAACGGCGCCAGCGCGAGCWWRCCEEGRQRRLLLLRKKEGAEEVRLLARFHASEAARDREPSGGDRP